MKFFLFYTITIMLLTACAEDKSQDPATQAVAELEQLLKASTQAEQQKQAANVQTPSSLTGDKPHAGPNPHAVLTSEQQIGVAMQHAQNGRMKEALDVIARAIIANPKDGNLFATLGTLLLTQERSTEALEYLNEAVSLAPNSAIILVNRSQAYRKLNRSRDAMTDLNKAIDLNPKLVPARFNRGVILYELVKYKQALADFNICVEQEPNTAGPYFNRSITREALDDLAGAKSDMKTFIKLSENPEWTKMAQDTLSKWKKTE